MTTERWRTVPGWEGVYEVSDLGRVRSVDRVIVNSRGRTYHLQGQLLKTPLNSRGYPKVGLSAPGQRIRHTEVHQLVLAAFVGPPMPGQETRHKDGNRADPRLSNLHYGTRAQNAADRTAHGTHSNGRADRICCPLNHLLKGRNLRKRRKNHRGCLACHAADRARYQARQKGKPEPDKRPYADRYYHNLLEGGPL